MIDWATFHKTENCPQCKAIRRAGRSKRVARRLRIAAWVAVYLVAAVAVAQIVVGAFGLSR